MLLQKVVQADVQELESNTLYKLIITMWFLYMNESFIYIMFDFFCGSCSLIVFRILTSTRAWVVNF